MQGQFISFYSNNTTLEIWLDVENGLLKNRTPLFGGILVTTGNLGDKELYWDNLDFFLNIKKKTFKKACREEVESIDLDWKEIYQDILGVLSKADGLGLLNTESKKNENEIIKSFFSSPPVISQQIREEAKRNYSEEKEHSSWVSSSTADYIGAPSEDVEELVKRKLEEELSNRIQEVYKRLGIGADVPF